MNSSYVVQPGDTIYRLAKRFHVSEKALMQANGLTNPSKLRVGMSLIVPGQQAVPEDTMPAEPARPALPEGWRWHVVGRGESLSQISARYGVDRSTLEAVNELTAGSASVYEGMELQIPPPGTVIAPPSAPAKTPPPGNHTVLAYTVQKGDTLESLATIFRTTPSTLARLNQLDERAPLAAGSKIVVPNHLFE